ncbi:hypothetical protein AB0N05_22155 [Nocardia sp. NPDC051030]|uniref:DUF7373 family lipoprotein n=1 Tax=Nocardia sp. NPDC051030 TaxID=3155162 RepID=UPI0034446F3D
MRSRFSGVFVALFGAAMLMVTAGCGGNDSGTPDYGSYPTARGSADYDGQPSRSRGILVESLRLGEHILYASEVDSELTTGRGGGVSAGFRGLKNNVMSAVTADAADRYNAVAGFGAIAANMPVQSDDSRATLLAASIVSFPDEQTATAAAAEMDRVDFEQSTDNVPVALDALPGALSHWRPGIPTMGSVMPWRTLVIRMYTQRPDPDLGRMVDLVTRAFQRQVALLADFVPTPAAELAKLTLDSDQLLTHVVRTGDPTPDAWDFAVYGPHPYSALLGRPATSFDTFSRYGITAIAVAYDKHLFRLRDPTAAIEYTKHLAETDNPDYAPINGVAGQSGITCAQAKRPDPHSDKAHRYRCIVTHGPYVAQVFSNVDIDVRRLAAAQYLVMGDS